MEEVQDLAFTDFPGVCAVDGDVGGVAFGCLGQGFEVQTGLLDVAGISGYFEFAAGADATGLGRDIGRVDVVDELDLDSRVVVLGLPLESVV